MSKPLSNPRTNVILIRGIGHVNRLPETLPEFGFGHHGVDLVSLAVADWNRRHRLLAVSSVGFYGARSWPIG